MKLHKFLYFQLVCVFVEDSTSLNRDKVSSTLNRYEITDSVRENSAVILNVMEQPKPSSFSNSTESSQNKVSKVRIFPQMHKIKCYLMVN